MDAFKVQLFSLKSESFGGFQILDNYWCIKTSKLLSYTTHDAIQFILVIVF